MNIFKILSSGDGRVHEPNISAYLSYLLDPNEKHGIHDGLLKLFLEPFISENEAMEEDLSFNGSILNLTKDSNFDIKVELEKKVKTPNGYRDIDIVINIYESTKLIYVVCIENKIKNSATRKGQLNDQLEGIKNELLRKESNPKILFIFLTPDNSTKTEDEFIDFKKQNPIINSKHYFWQDGDGKSTENITYMLRKLLQDEVIGLIEPIDEYSKYTLKSFLNFIGSDFSSYKEEKKTKKTKFKKPFREYIRDVYNELVFGENIEVSILKDKVVKKVLADNKGIKINTGTLNAQIYCVIVNAEVRKHYNIKETKKELFDMFYYINQKDRTTVKKIDPNNIPSGISFYYSKE